MSYYTTTTALLRLVNFVLYYHDCCIRHGPIQWEMAIFDHPTAPRPLNQFSWNFKYITTSRTRLRTQNFRGLRRRGWSGQIASLTHDSFCPFFPFFIALTGRIFDTSPCTVRHYASFPTRKCLLGLERWNLTPFTSKVVKIMLVIGKL